MATRRAPGKICPHCGEVNARLATLKCCQALGDPRDGLSVAEDLQRDVEAFEITKGGRH